MLAATCLLLALLCLFQISHIWRRKLRWEHDLGRDRLKAVITAARDAGMVFRSGDYAEVGEKSELRLGVEFESGLECIVTVTQKFDRVETWFEATGNKTDKFIGASYSVYEAMGMTRMVNNAQREWQVRKDSKLMKAYTA